MPAPPCDQGRTVLPYCVIQEYSRTSRALPRQSRPCIVATKQGVYEAGLSYYLRQVLECVSFWAEPYGGKEIVLGEIADGGAAGRCECWRLE
jgi:hypothetical protein